MQSNTALELRTYFGKELLNVEHLMTPHGMPAFLACEDGAYRLRLDGELDGGAVSEGGKVRALKLIEGDSIELKQSTRAVVESGGMSVALRFVSPPDRLEGRAFELDTLFANVLAIVFLCMSTAIFCLQLYPYEADAMEELMLNPRISVMIKETPKPIEQQLRAHELIERLEKKSQGGAAQGAKTPKPIGGTTKPRQLTATDLAQLPIFKSGGAFAKVLGADGGVINDATELALKDVGNERNADRGGLIARGEPNGTGSDPLAIGPGRDPLARRPGTYGEPNVLGGKREERAPVIDEGVVHTTGTMPPELIKAVMTENRNAFRYCYERELQVTNGLSGVVKVQFVIGPTGSVLSAKLLDTTMKNATVEQCLLGKVRALPFPKPNGGGVVIVNYPFVFKAAN